MTDCHSFTGQCGVPDILSIYRAGIPGRAGFSHGTGLAFEVSGAPEVQR